MTGLQFQERVSHGRGGVGLGTFNFGQGKLKSRTSLTGDYQFIRISVWELKLIPQLMQNQLRHYTYTDSRGNAVQ